jgi:phage baseplate assembly protein W
MTLQSFKNVGIRQFQVQNVLTTPQSITPIGIKTPAAFGDNGDGLFAMYTTIQEVVHDNLRNLLLTNHGERLVNFDLGANLRPLVAEFSSKDDFDGEAMIRINTAVAKWMPFISLVGFDSRPEFIDNRFTGRIVILVVYSVPQLGINEKALELLLFVI